MKTCDFCGKNPATEILIRISEQADGSNYLRYCSTICHSCKVKHDKHHAKFPPLD